MAFIEYEPRRTMVSLTSSSDVIINFSVNKKQRRLIIRIGIDLANKIDIKPGDKVSFSYDDENKRIWLIKKINTINGYKVGGKLNALRVILQIAYDENILFKPEEKEISHTRHVKSEIYEGGIKIDATLEL